MVKIPSPKKLTKRTLVKKVETSLPIEGMLTMSKKDIAQAKSYKIPKPKKI